MLARARRNLAEYRRTSGLNNVEFRLGEIEHLPVADATIDVVISNCVLNLSPDKPQVWREISRVLKPGGRVAISDLALLKPLPDAAQNHLAALVGCISGAILASDTQHMAEAAGLRDLQLTPRPAYIAGLAQAEDPLYRELNAALPAGQTLADYITSLELAARK
jgi:ubiquinone/menaquinone biosynthesis C-methylase UbiE